MGIEDKLGLITIDNAPLSVGTMVYGGGRITHKKGFAFDPSQLRVFVAGGAFEFYDPQKKGINVQLAMERAFNLGKALAKRNAVVVTGYTPVSSVPHAAAVGASEAGGFVIGVSPGSDLGTSEDRLRPYSLVWSLCIGSGNQAVDFGGRDFVNGLSEHMMVAIAGMHGTNHEMSIDRQLFWDRPMAVVKGVGGFPELVSNAYPLLNGGHQLLSSHNMETLADKIIRAGNMVKAKIDEKMPYFVDNLKKAGVPIIATVS